MTARATTTIWGGPLTAHLSRKSVFPEGAAVWTLELRDSAGTVRSNLMLEGSPRNEDPRPRAEALLEVGDYESQGPWVEVGPDQWSMKVMHAGRSRH